jgi:hypothetical protein
MLALLAAVALYFWAPLCLKLLRGGESAEDAVPAAPVALTPAVSDNATPGIPTPPEEVAKSWQELVNRMEQDPRRRASANLPANHDPFALPEPPKDKEFAKSTKASQAAPKPRQLGLKLNGTLLGTQRRLALINGKTYAEGEHVAAPEAEFVLRNVQAKEVTLEGGGQTIVLKAAVLKDAAPKVADLQAADRQDTAHDSRERDDE